MCVNVSHTHSLFLRSEIAILIAILTVTFLPYAIICAHALPGCFSSRYLHYMFFATIIYSLLLFSLFEQCKCCTSFYSDRWEFVFVSSFFGGYIGCVCFVWYFFFSVRFFHLLLHLLPVKSESPTETISKICSLAFLSTAKNALNLEFSTLTARCFSAHFLCCCISFVRPFVFGNFTVIV